MTSSKIAAWFLTNTAKKACFYAAGTAATGVLLANFLPHTLLIDKYKDIVHLYKNGMSAPLPKKLQTRFEKCLDLLEVDPIDKHLYKPFHCCGFDVMSAGSSYSKYGVIVGLPANFAYDNTDMVDKSKIKVNLESVIWDTEEGQKLLDALVISENAQIYAMAKEIKYRQTAKPLLDTIASSCICALVYSMSHHLNNKLNLFAKPRAARIFLYTIIGLFNYGLYITIKDMSQIYYETKIDEDLKKKNVIFAEGGREYYTKILERNKALRKMLGKEGESMYSIHGNENTLFRTKHIPIVQRKLTFEQPLQS